MSDRRLPQLRLLGRFRSTSRIAIAFGCGRHRKEQSRQQNNPYPHCNIMLCKHGALLPSIDLRAAARLTPPETRRKLKQIMQIESVAAAPVAAATSLIFLARIRQRRCFTSSLWTVTMPSPA
jgi:hypothetical protein